MFVELDILLVRPDAAMGDCWSKTFSGLPRVQVFQGKYEEMPAHDCFVTAGNSYGIMTGRELMRR